MDKRKSDIYRNCVRERERERERESEGKLRERDNATMRIMMREE